MRGKSRYNTYRAVFFREAALVTNSDVQWNAVSAAMYPVPINKIRADAKTSCHQNK